MATDAAIYLTSSDILIDGFRTGFGAGGFGLAGSQEGTILLRHG